MGATKWRFLANCWQALGLGGMEYGGRTWTWMPTWSAPMDIGGFDPAAAKRGAYAGLVQGWPPRPSPNPSPPQPPQLRQPHNRPPQPPGRLPQGPGGHLPRPGR